MAGVMRDWAGAQPAPPASVRSSRILPARGTLHLSIIFSIFILSRSIVLDQDLDLDKMCKD